MARSQEPEGVKCQQCTADYCLPRAQDLSAGVGHIVMKKYDFYQNLNARLAAIITVTGVTIFTCIFWYFLWRPIFATLSLGIMMTGIWSIGLLMFAHSEIPYIRTGGKWLIYIRNRILHIDFPNCEAERSFEIRIDDILEIQETRSRTWEGDRSGGGIRPTILLKTGSCDGHILPEPHEIRTDSLIDTLKSLRPDLPHKINGKRIDGQHSAG